MSKNQRGMTLAEVLFAVAMVAVLIFATIAATSTALTSTRNNADKQFGTQKALSMLEELKSLVQVNSGSNISVLDKYDDGTAYFSRLTTRGNKAADPPDDPPSGNKPMGSGWFYSRQISVKPLTDPSDSSVVVGSSDVRLIRVRVYKNDPSGGQRLLAEVASVVRTLAVTFPPTEVFDVYCVAIENVPGWWVNMSSLIPFVQNAINDLENRHPGLEFKQHWITHLAYGRDTQYIPFVNADALIASPTNDTLQPINYAYFYPGLLPLSYTPEAGGAAVTPPAQFYYPPGNFNGMIRTEAGVQNGVSASNPYPYAVADQYNHAMRYYDELNLYRARSGFNAVEEPTLRLLLDDMYMNPNKYLNALIINLHGELMPFPPIRNYSDAAKKPDFYLGASSAAPNGVRVVTHPEQLTYGNSDDVELRVYSYVTDPRMNGTNTDLANKVYKYPGGVKTDLVDAQPSREFLREPVTIILRAVNWTPAQTASSFVKAITGGPDFDMSGARDAYSTGMAPTTDDPTPNHYRMYFTFSYVPPVAPATVGDTVIKLYNSPLVSPCLDTLCSTGGLASERRLYGMEYIPAPLEDFTSGGAVAAFQAANNLDSTGDHEVNTARWLLHIPENVFSGQDNQAFRIETRIGDYDPTLSPPAFTDGYSQPTDLSTTYTWRGSDTWLYGAGGSTPNLPISERYQIQGDPRHCPYADLKKPHNSNGGAFTAANSNIGGGYNPNFDDFEAAGTEGNRAGADYISNPASLGPYAITASNQVFSLKINGAAAFNVNLTIGAARTTLQIVTELNANATFSPKATATLIGVSPNGRILITSKTPGAASAVQFAAPANNCNTILGFDTAVHARASWPGWFYTISGIKYGINNDGVYGNGGWKSGTNSTASNSSLEVDVNRIYQIIRGSLMKSNALFTTMTGWPYYYLGIGNEIGYDAANGFPDNIPVNRRPFNGTDTAQYFEQNITPGTGWGDGVNPPTASTTGSLRSGVKLIQESDGSWWGMPWIGELYPDKMYNLASGTDWKDFGNIPTATPGSPTAPNTYRRVRREDVPANTATNPTHTLGTMFIHSDRRTHQQGMVTFFWTGTASAVEADSGGTLGNIAAGGTEINANYNFTLDNPISATRPFQTATAAPTTDGLGLALYGPNNTVSTLTTFYTSNEAGRLASALLASRTGATTDAVFVVENGLSPSGTAGTDFIARWSFLTLIQGFLQSGTFNGYAAPAVTQVPRVMVTDPNPNTDLTNPTSVTINWAITWKRWDGKPYTTSYAGTYNPAVTMSYLPMYSADNGLTWKYVKDDSAAVPGTRLPLADSRYVSAQTYAWNVSDTTKFPAGVYTIRVECYRNNFPLHYSFHQYQAFINRT